MEHTKAGDFVWYDLFTTDPAAAVGFYGDVIGWKTRPFGDDGYRMWEGSQGPLGGVIELPKELIERSIPSHWMSHVQVSDVHATVAEVKTLGGKVHHEPTRIPTIGTFAVIGDPQGAVINAFTPERPMTPHDRAKPGEFGWSELLIPDVTAALSYYRKIFGWKKRGEVDMGPMGVYTIYGDDARDLGGMMPLPKEIPWPVWNYYVEVADIDEAIARAKAKGGKLVHGPHEVPGGGRAAQLQDPQGCAFALSQSKVA